MPDLPSSAGFALPRLRQLRAGLRPPLPLHTGKPSLPLSPSTQFPLRAPPPARAPPIPLHHHPSTLPCSVPVHSRPSFRCITLPPPHPPCLTVPPPSDLTTSSHLPLDRGTSELHRRSQLPLLYPLPRVCLRLSRYQKFARPPSPSSPDHNLKHLLTTTLNTPPISPPYPSHNHTSPPPSPPTQHHPPDRPHYHPHHHLDHHLSPPSS